MRAFNFKFALFTCFFAFLLYGCKSSKTSGQSNDCVDGYFVADLRGKVSPNVLEYAKHKYGVSFQKTLNNTLNTSLYSFDTSLITLDELLNMMTESEFCESASCYSNSIEK